MFSILKQIFNPKNKDLQKRILFTLAVLFIFIIGTSIIVPGVDVKMTNLSIFEVINAMSGGAFERASIFALGVTPYITAQIIVQLLCMDIIPYFSELSKQGGTGKRKLDQITRIFSMVLAFFQGYLYSFAYIKNGTAMDYMLYSLILTAGTALLMWLADRITQKGIGSGMSLIIMAGIINVLPNMFVSLWNELIPNGFIGLLTFILFIIVFIFIIVGVIYVETAQRRLPIQYANKSTASKEQSYIPFKLNSAGVMPVIFASAILTIPQILASVIKNEGFKLFVTKYLSYNSSIIGLLIYLLLILGFTFIYTFMQIKPKEMADNLNKNGGYIPGIRPGKETITYVSNVLKRITLIGGIFLAILAGLPIIFSKVSTFNTSISISGTGLLIVVGVLLETYKQIESELTSSTYTKGRRSRSRR